MNKITLSKWNYRILVKNTKEGLYFSINEVYYENDTPSGYIETSSNLEGESIKDIKWRINKTKEAFKKPILWKEPKFPKEYKA